MLRSLYSGIAGLSAHRTRMDVIGNNIANVNTTGFKSSRTNFQDVLYQKIKSGGNSRNPAFVGTGVDIAGISTNFKQGPLQNTGRTLDLAIQGDGFFKVNDSNGNEFYTRDGVFFIDKDGYLVNSNGYKVQGSVGDIQINNSDKIESINIKPDGEINVTYNDATPDATFGPIAVYKFSNAEGLTKSGNNLYQEATDISGAATQVTLGGTTKIASGYLEMSNVDLSNEFVNMITTQRGFQANARTITVSDQLLEELVNLKR
ncbi:MAG: flagellar basal-body rod protein FlgF [Desulfotomaculum sp.]|nr:flagellar basal-body rod protein FlgF [Desulfotomaculum sp.]